MVDIAIDAKYSLRSAAAFLAFNVAAGIAPFVSQQFAMVIQGLVSMLNPILLPLLLFSYAGFRAVKEGGRKLADSALSGLIAAAATMLFLCAFAVAKVSAMGIYNGAGAVLGNSIPPIILSFLGSTPSMLIMGLVFGLAGGFIAQCLANGKPQPSGNASGKAAGTSQQATPLPNSPSV